MSRLFPSLLTKNVAAVTPVEKLIPYEAYEHEIQELLKLLKELAIPIPDQADIHWDYDKAFEFFYYALFSDERPAQFDDLTGARIHAGLGDLAAKINKAWKHPTSSVLRPHLAKMIQGGVRMNEGSVVYDDAANKTCELYVGCLALGCGWPINLDDPDKSSGGLNPDVILNREGQSWSIAVKTIYGTSNQTIFDNIQHAVGQIERASKPGIIFINLKNRIAKLLPDNCIYNSALDATEVIKGIMRTIIEQLRVDIVYEDWVKTFECKQARPLVGFMAHTLASVRISPGQDAFVPVRFLMALPVPPLPPGLSFQDLDQSALDLIKELNHELQAAPGAIFK